MNKLTKQKISLLLDSILLHTAYMNGSQTQHKSILREINMIKRLALITEKKKDA